MEFREPKRKRRVRVSLQQPFPILNKDVIAIPTNNALWQVYTGKYSGDFVVVEAPDEMAALHNMGFFGKGSLSRRNPEFGKTRQGVPPLIRQRQYECRKNWAEKQEALIKEYEGKQSLAFKDISQKVSSSQCCDKEDTSEKATAEENVGENADTSELSNSNNKNIISESLNEVDSILKETNSNEKNKKAINETTNEVNTENMDDEVIMLDSAEEDNGSGIIKGSDVLNEPKQYENIQTKNEKQNSESEHQTNNEEQNSESEQKLQRGVKRKNSTDLQSSPKSADIIDVDNCCLEDNCEDLSRGKNLDDESKVKNITDMQNSPRSLDVIEIVNNSAKYKNSECQSYENKKNMLLVLPDSDSDDENYLTNLQPKLEKEPFPIYEALHLTLEESFFLSYGLGCLQIVDLFGNYLSLDGIWQLFCKFQKDFIQKYVTYHYFRSKGWVVKPGIKFGGDFLLYKQGPPFYHASYIVIIEVLHKSTWTRVPELKQNLSWTRLMGLNRLAESTGKEILLCQVIWPDVRPENLEFPSVLSKFQVHEVLIRRWISSQEREEIDIH